MDNFGQDIIDRTWYTKNPLELERFCGFRTFACTELLNSQRALTETATWKRLHSSHFSSCHRPWMEHVPLGKFGQKISTATNPESIPTRKAGLLLSIAIMDSHHLVLFQDLRLWGPQKWAKRSFKHNNENSPHLQKNHARSDLPRYSQKSSDSP